MLETSIDQIEISIAGSFSNAEIICEKWEPLVIVSWGGMVPAIGADTAVVAATGLPPCTHPFYNSTGIRATPDATWVDVNSSGELKFENRRTSQGLNSCTWAGELIYFSAS